MKNSFMVQINFHRKVSKNHWEFVSTHKTQAEAMDSIRKMKAVSYPMRIVKIVRTIVLEIK